MSCIDIFIKTIDYLKYMITRK